MNNLTKLSVVEMRSGLLDQQFSSAELTKAHFERIKQTNQDLNSFLLLTEELALQQAAAADRILTEQKNNSPLLTGIPIAIKDMLITEGIETTCASKILKGFVPPYDCTAVSKLRQHNAVILGKTNLDEFAMGSSNENSAFGSVRNPWDHTRVPGGSSGGSAAAVAAGQAPLALGTDTGGSIRQPAAFTGIIGLKPTYGRVSRYGAVAFASSLDQIGPFARSIEDMAIILSAVSGQDPHDSTSMKIEVPNFYQEVCENKGSGLKGLRVGVPREYFIPGIDNEVEESVKNSLKILEKLGATLVDISLPHTEFATAVYYIIAPAEASSNLARYDGVRYGLRAKDCKSITEMYEKTRAEGFGWEVKRRILIGTYVLSTGYYDAYYLKAQQVRTLIINDFKAAFTNTCDIIATPVSPTTAFKLGENINSPLKMYLADIFTIPTSLAGLPGISVPCGLDHQNLPIGIQFICPPFAESLLLKVGDALLEENKFNTASMAA